MASSGDSEERSFSIPKLTRKNYTAWMARVKAELLVKKCYMAVTGYPEQEEALTAAEIASRAHKNLEALAVIIRSVSDELINDIINFDDAKEAWEELDRLCNKNTEYGAMVKFRKMFHIVKTPDMSMSEYISTLTNMNTTLTKNDLGLKDKALAALILTGLPDEYEITVKTLVSTNQVKVSSVKQTLLEEESEKATRAEDTVTHQALKVSKGNRSNQNNQNKRGRNKKTEKSDPPKDDTGNDKEKPQRRFYCFACGVEGHYASDCPKSKNDEQKKPEKKASASITTRQHIVLCAQKVRKGRYNIWILDGGASDHMSYQKENFTEMRPSTGTVEIGDGTPLKIEGIGTVVICMSDECGGMDVELREVLYVPELQDNLISQGQIEEKGMEFRSKDGVSRCLYEDKLLFQAIRIGRLYYATTTSGPTIQEAKQAYEDGSKKASRVSRDTWHSRLGHPCDQYLSKMEVLDLPKKGGMEDPPCAPCLEGKMKRDSFPNEKLVKVEKALERVHSDIMGPIKPASLGGKRFIVTFVDEFTRHVTVSAITHKNEAFEEFKKYKEKSETLHEAKIKELQSDRGTEYMAGYFQEYLEEHGVSHRTSTPYTPQQNGLAERMNLTLSDIVRCFLIEAGAPAYFWAEALETAVRVRNLRPSRSLGFGIPLERWLGRPLVKSDYDYLRVFGCRAWAWIPDVQREGKFAPRARPCIFLGYEKGTKGWRLWDKKERKIIVSRDVAFREDVFPFKLPLPTPPEDVVPPFRVPSEDGEEQIDGEAQVDGEAQRLILAQAEQAKAEAQRLQDERLRQVEVQRAEAEKARAETQRLQDEQAKAQRLQDEQAETQRLQDEQAETQRLQDEKAKAQRLQDEQLRQAEAQMQTNNETPETTPVTTPLQAPTSGTPGETPEPETTPTTVPQTGTTSDDESEAEGAGRRSSSRTRTPKVVCSLPCCLKAVSHPDGAEPLTVEEALSGPDAEQWRQAMMTELQLMVNLQTWEVVPRPEKTNIVGCRWVFTTKRANGQIVRYKARLVAKGFSQVRGVDYFETFSPVVQRKSLKILMSIALEKDWEIDHCDIVGAYLNSKLDVPIFMEQAPAFPSANPKQFVYKLLKSVYGLKQAGRNWNHHIDSLLKKFGLVQCVQDPCIYKGEDLIVAVYVDDLLLLGVKAKLEDLKKYLSEYLNMKDLGPVSNFLSVQIYRFNRDSLILTQKTYIEEILQEFGMADCRGASMPLELDCAKVDRDNSKSFCEAKYRKCVGKLLYVSGITRADIAHAVCFVSQYCNNPLESDWKNVLHILQYLKATKNYGLHYFKSGEKLQVFVDADFANNKEDSISITGYVFLLASAAVVWKSKKQRVDVASSSTFAEYVAMYQCATDVVWLKDLLCELGLQDMMALPCTIFTDNTGAISISESNAVSDKTKHIRVKYHYVRKLVSNGEAIFEYVKSTSNLADLFTKPLSGKATKDFAFSLGIF